VTKKADEIKVVNQLLLRLVSRTLVSIVYLHHHRKSAPGEKRGQLSLRGSTELAAKVASHFMLDSTKVFDEAKNTILNIQLSQHKSRRPDSISSISMRCLYDIQMKNTAFEYIENVSASLQIKQNATERTTITVQSVLQQNRDGLDIQQLINVTGCGETSVRRACKNLKDSGLISSKKGTGKCWNKETFFIKGTQDVDANDPSIA
jgi:hypothetical protein